MQLYQNLTVGLKASLTGMLFTVIGMYSTLTSATESAPVEHREVIIWSEGVRLAGDIYSPPSNVSGRSLPGILMIPGWGGSKENVGENYARHFAEAGFVVLTFDFKGWGKSDGPLLAAAKLVPTDDVSDVTRNARHIRKVINPFSMSADVRAALHYLGGEPGVMPNNIGVWGTSMGGALALVSATSDDRIKAWVTQMGPVNNSYNFRQLTQQLMRRAETGAARGEISPYPGPESEGHPSLSGYPDWVALQRFDPLAALDLLQAPTLIIDAAQENLFDPARNGAELYEAIKDRLPARYVIYPGGHYEMYRGENLSAARSEALAWFSRYLN